MVDSQSLRGAGSVSTASVVTGWVIGLLPVLLLLFSAVMKLARVPSVVDGFHKFGYADGVIRTIGIVELVCTVVYLLPQTAMLGAILLTGYLGGATATQVRIGDPTFFAPILCGILLWVGLFLRDPRLRVLVPLRSQDDRIIK